MDRSDIEFAVGYSCRLEKMSASLWGRIDKIISASQFCLGASAFASIADLKVFGCLLALSSIYTLVYQPGSRAALADLQKRQYESLYARRSSLSDDNLRDAYAKIQENDSPEVGALCNAAYHGEQIRLGVPTTNELGLLEKILAWIAGDLPRA